MMQLSLRKTVYLLLGLAVALNVTVGLMRDGIIRYPFDDGPLSGTNPVEADTVFEVPPIRAGDVYVTERNMSIHMEGSEDSREGNYLLDGRMTRTFSEIGETQRLKGDYTFTYSDNGTDDLVFSGQMDRSRDISPTAFSGDFGQRLHTSLTVTGPMLSKESSSDITVELNEGQGSWRELLWRELLDEIAPLEDGGAGTVSQDISLPEAGLYMAGMELSWRVNGIPENDDMMFLEISGQSDEGMEVRMELHLSRNSPFPESILMTFKGYYECDGSGSVMELTITEDLLDVSLGVGDEIDMDSWLDIGPPYVPGEPVPIDVVTPGGEESSLHSTPEECLEYCIEESQDLSEFIEGHGRDEVSVSMSRYFKNESIRRSDWLWNITISPETEGALSYYILVGSNPRVGKLNIRQFDIISEGYVRTRAHPDPQRTIIDLDSNERILKNTVYGDQLFGQEDHSSSYGLDIIWRGDKGTNPLSGLLHNMLGLEMAMARDLFISYSQDRRDPTVLYVVAVDGSDGRVLSLTKASGFCTILMSSLDLELA